MIMIVMQFDAQHWKNRVDVMFVAWVNAYEVGPRNNRNKRIN